MASPSAASRVSETTTSTGSGNITLSGARTGFQTFNAAYSTSVEFYYVIEAIDGSNIPTGDWEYGIGHLSASTTLVRDIVLASSNSNVVVTLASGTKNIFSPGQTVVTPAPTPPQGRLTLQTTVPVQTADQTAKGTVYYDSYVGNAAPIWDGYQWRPLTIASDEISMGMNSSHVVSGSVYDIFGINNSGSLVLAVGPAWSTTASRGTGAGTTELQLVNGIWTNKNSLTHAWGGAAGTTDYGAVSANQATYLGSLYATANAQTGVALKPAVAGGGGNTIVGLYNAYNQVPASATSRDNTSTWTNNSATWRPTNNNNNNRVSYLDGLGNIAVSTKIQAYISPSTTSVSGQIGVVLNATTGTPVSVAQVGGGMPASSAAVVTASDFFYPALGFNFVQGMEAESSAVNVTFLGAGPPQFQLLAISLQI